MSKKYPVEWEEGLKKCNPDETGFIPKRAPAIEDLAKWFSWGVAKNLGRSMVPSGAETECHFVATFEVLCFDTHGNEFYSPGVSKSYKASGYDEFRELLAGHEALHSELERIRLEQIQRQTDS